MNSLIPLVQAPPAAPGVSTQGAQVAARFFRGLGDPTRIRILQLLLEGERSVSELVNILGSPQGRVSSHLSCLRWCGFVEPQRRGRNVYYSVADPRVRQILELGDAVIADAAERILSCQILDGELDGVAVAEE